MEPLDDLRFQIDDLRLTISKTKPNLYEFNRQSSIVNIV